MIHISFLQRVQTLLRSIGFASLDCKEGACLAFATETPCSSFCIFGGVKLFFLTVDQALRRNNTCVEETRAFDSDQGT